MNFFNYWKLAKDKNFEFKKKVILFENIIINSNIPAVATNYRDEL